MSDYDDEPGRGRPTVAIVIAVVFLAVLGGSVGYILATNHQSSGGNGGTSAPSTRPATATTPTGTGTGTAKATRSASPSAKPARSYPPANAADCPAQAKEAAGTSLLLVQYLLTERSEVWICRDSPGNLFYQGHVRNKPFTGPTTDTSIFLIDVRQEGGNYRATNNDTEYVVSPNRLRILKNGSEIANEPSVNG